VKRIIIIGASLAAAAIGALAYTSGADAKTPPKPLPRVVVYVESQGLCYDSIVTAQDLPDHGPFQSLEPDPANHCGSTPALKTAYGPGDKGYVGGRWMMRMPDGSVVHFSCPLIGPGTPPVD
jgi:hypothetical protein